MLLLFISLIAILYLIGAFLLGSIHITYPKEIFHVVLSTLTVGAILLSALQAAILAVQDRSLHQHKPFFTKQLPSMESMEIFLFKTVIISFLLLTTTLISSAFLFPKSLSLYFFTEKILLSFCAWLVFAILIIGRFMFGWRGRTAVNWTFLGTSLLLLIYFGSILMNYTQK